MKILVTYDVNTMERTGQKRLRQVARACLDYGQRVQNSVFECNVSATELAILFDRLKNIVNEQEDSIRIYYLSKSSSHQTLVLGHETAYDTEGLLLI